MRTYDQLSIGKMGSHMLKLLPGLSVLQTRRRFFLSSPDEFPDEFADELESGFSGGGGGVKAGMQQTTESGSFSVQCGERCGAHSPAGSQRVCGP